MRKKWNKNLLIVNKWFAINKDKIEEWTTDFNYEKWLPLWMKNNFISFTMIVNIFDDKFVICWWSMILSFEKDIELQ